MADANCNIIVDILKMISVLTDMQKKLDSMPAAKAMDAKEMLHNCDSMLTDFKLELCKLISAVTSSPLNGKMFMPPPQYYIDSLTRQKSVDYQLNGDAVH